MVAYPQLKSQYQFHIWRWAIMQRTAYLSATLQVRSSISFTQRKFVIRDFEVIVSLAHEPRVQSDPVMPSYDNSWFKRGWSTEVQALKWLASRKRSAFRVQRICARSRRNFFLYLQKSKEVRARLRWLSGSRTTREKNLIGNRKDRHHDSENFALWKLNYVLMQL